MADVACGTLLESGIPGRCPAAGPSHGAVSLPQTRTGVSPFSTLSVGRASLLRWDAAVMMPRGSADVRGEQLAVLESECHALLTSPKVSRLIERAQAGAAQLEDWQLANLREMRRERDHAIATPLSLVTRLARATAVRSALARG